MCSSDLLDISMAAQESHILPSKLLAELQCLPSNGRSLVVVLAKVLRYAHWILRMCASRTPAQQNRKLGVDRNQRCQ